ncbi:MAG: M23 family metallopeptidase [Dehalococcoidia bacterium]
MVHSHSSPGPHALHECLSRRSLLRRIARGATAGALIAPLSACAHLLEPDPPPGVTIIEAPPIPLATVDATPDPTPMAMPTPPDVQLNPAEIGQGETVLIVVRQPAASAGSIELLGQRMPLIRDRDALWAIAGAGLLTPVGAYEATVTTRNAEGAVLHTAAVPYSVVPVDRPVDYLIASPEVTAVLTVEAAETEAALRAYEQFNLFESRPRWSGPIQQPCEGIITTAFGQGRSTNGGPVTGQHSGTDIANISGTPIVAATDGRIAWAGWMPIRGNSVLVDHGAGVVTGYHHLLRADIETGRDVRAGDQIGRMGSTGFSTGPHLHWEMTIFGVNVDPMTWTTRDFSPSPAT